MLGWVVAETMVVMTGEPEEEEEGEEEGEEERRGRRGGGEGEERKEGKDREAEERGRRREKKGKERLERLSYSYFSCSFHNGSCAWLVAEQINALSGRNCHMYSC